ncbi:carbohydrate esterase family 3 protein [Pleomassaria siparia CBS 279.74]|uniref:Carbohydrate esterase family 3 protein n=1 Tax=Pleomassaria siparia CBS 279.74 TaxID=1314801 RepID=A0A6G1K0U3_9PLEO|nr:carbohydrate esterase family 3 protein [Pleomassaria siparia CBS 279.74]
MRAWRVFLNVFVLSSVAGALNTTSTPFRAMALGASVTFGVGSTTGNSYRKNLQDLMTASNMTIEYVGTKNNGDFANNAVEATNGFVISQIAAAAQTAVPKLLPNLVLIDAGTNNCNSGGTVPDAGANMTNMINHVFAQSPGSTVILTTILVNSVAKQDACRVDENKQIATLAVSMQAAGKKLVLVDMRGPDGPLVTDLADGRHPNDAGYVKMANVWFGGVQEVVAKGLLSPPANAPSSAANSTSSNNGTMASSATKDDSAKVAASSPVMMMSLASSVMPTSVLILGIDIAFIRGYVPFFALLVFLVL